MRELTVARCFMVVRINLLWEQDVGGSNPLAPTKCLASAE